MIGPILSPVNSDQHYALKFWPKTSLIINYASLCTNHKVKVLKAKPYIPHTKLFFRFLLNSLSKSEKSKKWSGYRPKRKYDLKRSESGKMVV